MKEIIETLYPMNRYLVGADYDSAMMYLRTLIDLEIFKVPSGTVVSDWTVPEEWVMKDGWVKFNGEKILDYKVEPLSVMVGSVAVNKKIDLAEFKKHLKFSDDNPSATPYAYTFYNKDEESWAFCMPKDKVKKEVAMKCVGGVCTPWLHEFDAEVGQVQIDGSEIKQEWFELLEEGEYEVFIDSEHRPTDMQIGIHTIKGKSDREILLFAHLDHPYQANDNLSGVACLVDMANKLKDKYEHTIKIIICPETIGGIAYGTLKDISRVDFVVTVDILGNDNSLCIQKAFDKYDRLNYVVHLAHSGQAIDYRKGDWRLLGGGEEYFFSDPKIEIPGIFLTRLPYKEYHTSDDKPELINYAKIEEVQKAIMKLIEIYELDFIPERLLTGPLMRSKYGVQTPHKTVNLGMDYIWYDMDGVKYLSQLVLPTGISFETVYKAMMNLLEGGAIKKNEDPRINSSKRKITKAGGKKSKSV